MAILRARRHTDRLTDGSQCLMPPSRGTLVYELTGSVARARNCLCVGSLLSWAGPGAASLSSDDRPRNNRCTHRRTWQTDTAAAGDAWRGCYSASVERAVCL